MKNIGVSPKLFKRILSCALGVNNLSSMANMLFLLFLDSLFIFQEAFKKKSQNIWQIFHIKYEAFVFHQNPTISILRWFKI